MSQFVSPPILKQNALGNKPIYIWFFNGSSWEISYSFVNGVYTSMSVNAPSLASINTIPNTTSSSSTSVSANAGGKQFQFKRKGTYQGLVSYFPPITYDISCLDIDITGGQEIGNNYIVTVVLSLDLIDTTTNLLIYTVYSVRDITVPGPVKGMGGYSDNTTNPPSLIFFVKHGTELILEDLTESNATTHSSFLLTKPGLSTDPVAISIQGDYRIANVKLESYTVEKEDGGIDTTSAQTIKGKMCTMIIRDRRGIIAEEQFLGKPSVQFSNQPPTP